MRYRGHGARSNHSDGMYFQKIPPGRVLLVG